MFFITLCFHNFHFAGNVSPKIENLFFFYNFDKNLTFLKTLQNYEHLDIWMFSIAYLSFPHVSFFKSRIIKTPSFEGLEQYFRTTTHLKQFHFLSYYERSILDSVWDIWMPANLKNFSNMHKFLMGNFSDEPTWVSEFSGFIFNSNVCSRNFQFFRILFLFSSTQLTSIVNWILVEFPTSTESRSGIAALPFRTPRIPAKTRRQSARENWGNKGRPCRRPFA